MQSNEHCNRNCKANAHGQSITNVLLYNCTLPDEQVAAYIMKVCSNFTTVTDYQGQLAIHVAAACNRYKILEWLLHKGADVNACDKQLGQTALHRAIQYGNLSCVLLLLRYGARIDINDKKHKSPAQYACKLPPNTEATIQNSKHQRNKEIFVWGSNRNYNLGLNSREGKQQPYSLDFFSWKGMCVHSASLSEYHCLYVTDGGKLYAVGLGDGGRLGTNQENTLCEPQMIVVRDLRKDEIVTHASAARHNSIILTSRNRVMTTGSNKYGQLGHSNMQQSLVFREVDFGTDDVPNRVGVIACEYHCLAYTSNCVHVWGENRGQFGFEEKVARIDKPTQLKTFRNKIVQVVSSNKAICIVSTEVILLYAKYLVRALKKPIMHESVKHIAIRNGELTETLIQSDSPLSESIEILVVTESDAIYFWSFHDQKYVRCNLTIPVSVKQIHWVDNIVHIISTDGILYRGVFQDPIRNTSKFIDDANDDGFINATKRTDFNSNLRLQIQMCSVPKIDRVCDIAVDEKASSFIALQEDSKKYVDKPDLTLEPMTLKELLLEVTEDDKMHDIIFHVDNEQFPAHKFVIFSRAEGLRDIILKSSDEKNIQLEYKYLTAAFFRLILKYIYTDYTCSIADIERLEASYNPHNGLTNLDIYSRMRKLIGIFGVAPMFDRLAPGEQVKYTPMKFNRSDYTDMYDITIKCADNKTISAHRCILSARLEYFNMMLNNDWTESTQSTIDIDVPAEYMAALIDFLYNDDFAYIHKQQYKSVFLCHLVEICDRFFASKLKAFCEVLLSDRLRARNCIDMLELSMIFNAPILETAALQYISYNFGRLLENQLLFDLNADTVANLSEYYNKVFSPPEPSYTEVDSSYGFGDSIDVQAILDVIGDSKVNLKDAEKAAKAKATLMIASKAPKSRRSDQSKASARRSIEKEALKMTKRIDTLEEASVAITRKMEDCVISEATQIAEKHSSEAKKWMTVPDKKDVRKTPVLAALKSNEVLRNEPKEQQQFTNLNWGTAANSYKQSPRLSVSEEVTGPSAPNLSLSDFTPLKSQKMSQKQRRRQLSQSEPSPVAESIAHSPVSTFVWAPMTSTPAENLDNPWKQQDPDESKNSRQPKIDDLKGKPSHSSGNGSTINKRLFPPNSKTRESTASSKCDEISLNKILADQRQQKANYLRMTNKSLQLTQTEEKAIDELNAFYNVDNVSDEHIVIERVPKVMPTINFAKWTQQ